MGSLNYLTRGLPTVTPAHLIRLAAYVLLALLGAALWLRLLTFPDATLDPSWCEPYGYFFTHRLQAGVDYMFTFGPLGYFNTYVYHPDLFWAKYWHEVTFKLIAVVLVLRFTACLPGLSIRLLFCATLVVLGWMLPLEPLIILLLGIIAVNAEKSSFRWWAPVCLLLAILSLVKFTFLILVVVVLALVCLNILGSRGRWAALWPPTLFAAWFGLLWLALGQSPVNLPRYLVTSLQITSGYDAMAWPGNADEVYLALLISAALGAALLPFSAPGLRAAWRGPGALRQLSRLGLLGAVVFLQWKQGFTRHDLHAVYFFGFVPVVPFLLPALFPDYNWAAPARVWLTAACFFLSFIGLTMSSGIKWRDDLPSIRREVVQSGKTALDPSGLRFRLEELRAAEQQEFALPLVKARVGDAPVDVISYDQGVLLLNGLNWRPRPVFQSYSAYTPALLKANARFFRSDRAPEYVLLKLQAIDGRLPALEDGPALLELLRRYRPELVEKGYLLLQRREPGGEEGPPAGEVVLERRVRLGEEVDLRGLPGRFHTLSLRLEPSWRGRLRTFLFKSPEVRIAVRTADGQAHSYRLIPAMAEGEFILSPLLQGMDDFVNLYDGGPPGGNRVTALSLSTARPSSYAREVVVTVRAYDSLAGRGVDGPADLYRLKHPGAVTAGAVTAADGARIAGWAWDLRRSGEPVAVDVYADGALVEKVLADRHSQEAAAARIGDGRHGFSLDTPEHLRDSRPHAVQVRVSGTERVLAEGALLASPPGQDKAAANFVACIDEVNEKGIAGWAWDSHSPNFPLTVEVYVDDTQLASVSADQFRPDLRDAGIGDGRHAFTLPTSVLPKDGKPHAVRVKVAGTGGTIVQKGVLLPRQAERP
jgi:hypothetical protein